jgi:hypothetical protein
MRTRLRWVRNHLRWGRNTGKEQCWERWDRMLKESGDLPDWDGLLCLDCLIPAQELENGLDILRHQPPPYPEIAAYIWLAFPQHYSLLKC